jgi:hypothetical protein
MIKAGASLTAACLNVCASCPQVTVRMVNQRVGEVQVDALVKWYPAWDR